MFDFHLGQRATVTRRFGRSDVAEFLAFVGAIDDDGATVPTGLVGGLFSQLLGTSLPGRGTNWMKQSLRFHARAKVGERLTASVQIVRLRPDKQLVNLRVECVDAGGALICDGEALVMAREMA
jgi:3-hydroxybutyryl-CoA dehydratase